MKSTRRISKSVQEAINSELFAAEPTKMLERSYRSVTANEITNAQTHLNPIEQQLIHELFSKYVQVFDGKLGHYNKRKISLQLIRDARPYSQRRPYPVPFQRRKLFEDELYAMIADGVLERVEGLSEWSFPTFIIPKKDGRVRWVTDFCELNKLIVRKSYPLPKIQDIINGRSNYRYFTKTELSMMLYCFELDEHSQRLCVITTEFGTYRYLRLPMGVKVSPDVAQNIMEEILQGTDCSIYMDDVGVWTNGTFKSHLQVLDQILKQFNDNNLKCNPLKCSWAVQETDFLGYWMTPTGIKPWKK